MYTFIEIDWQTHFGWSDDYIETINQKAERSKKSTSELVDLIYRDANSIINFFTSHGKKNDTPIYRESYGNDAGMIVFLYTLSLWEGENDFLIDFADALYKAPFHLQETESKLEFFYKNCHSPFNPIEIDIFALLSRIPLNISKRAKELIYIDFNPRIHYLVSRVKEKFLFDDLVSTCWEVLYGDIIFKYKPEKGHFATYATTSIIRRIQKYIDAQSMVKVNERSMKRRRERGETTFIHRDYGLSINSERGYTFESYFIDSDVNVEEEALDRIESERAQRILAECREILSFPNKCDLSIGRYLKYKGYAYPGVDPKNTREIAKEDCVSLRAIQISIRQAERKLVEFGKKYPILLHLVDGEEYRTIIDNKEHKDEEKKSIFPEDEGWLPL